MGIYLKLTLYKDNLLRQDPPQQATHTLWLQDNPLARFITYRDIPPGFKWVVRIKIFTSLKLLLPLKKPP